MIIIFFKHIKVLLVFLFKSKLLLYAFHFTDLFLKATTKMVSD